MVDWGKLGGDLYDGAGKLVDKGKELVGEGIDKGTDVLGSGLEKVGADQWADAVEDWGDETASSLGAEVGEKQLGQTEEANELIHGRPEKISAAVKNLRDFQKAFDLVGGGMKKLDSGHWKGEAADAFREKFQTLPTDWLRAADAFEDAATALETYAGTVTSAQAKAREAIALYKEGKQDYETAAAAFREKAAAYNAVRNTDHPLPHPGTFSDPSVAKRQHAQEILEHARRARNEAAEAAKSAITTAMAHAPKEPTGLNRAKQEFIDYEVGQGIELAHFGGGVVKGTAGLVNFVRSVNPTDPYNLTHPAEYVKGVHMTLAGLVSTAANPDRALKNAWDAAKGDPSEFIGRLVPEMIGTKGGGLIKGGLRAGMKDLLKHPKGKNRHGHEKNPDSNAKKCSDVKCAGDPVDVATGRMLLPQTDITLPGSLPLVFERVFDSSYRAGRWFGSGWSSTVDQRLEIDAEGVVFSCDEGSLLAYPHPAPGVPVMPTHGRRWPLDRVDDGYTVTDPETGRVRHFVDHPNGKLALLAQIDDRNGRWITFEHDETGAPASIVHHGGYHLKLTTNEGRVTALHLAGAAPDGTDQEILRYGYTNGHLTEVTNSSGKPLRFGYDELGRITSWTDTNGSRYEYVYDEHDRCVYQTGTNGHLEAQFTWDDTDPDTGLRMTSMTDGLGHTKRYVINDRSQVVAEINALGAVTRYEYDRYHRLLSVTDPLGHVIRSTYDEQGRMTVVERPDGRQTRTEYNELGLPIRIIGTDGNVTRQIFDERGNRTSVTESSGATTAFTYDDTGMLTSVTDPLGHTSTVASDKAELPLGITDPLGAVTEYERDAFGRPVSITDPLGAVTRLEWTVEGKLARRIEPDGSTQVWMYDGEGNCLSHTDAMGGTTRFEYTIFDLLTARTSPDGVRYEFIHDTNLCLTKVTNPQALAWTYTYDPAGHLVAETDFDDRTLTYMYDAAGRLTSRTNALAQTVTYEHNALGQVVRKDAAGAVTVFEYDIFDELGVATGPDATLVRLRDRFGRLKSDTVNGRTLSFTHDALGRRTGRTTPGGAASSWSYDAAGRRASLTASGRTLTFTHDALGRETSRMVDGFVSLTSSFDVMGRLTAQEITAGGGRRLQHRAYAYRPDGNLVGMVDALSGARRFDLDAAGRVTAVHAAGWTERYVYDEAGNQAEASWPPTHPSHESTGPRTYTGTGITRAGSVRYEHDAQGRTVLRQKTRLSRKPETWRYAWDAEDRLTSVATPDGTVWRYVYDPLGRRISKQSPLETVHFTWDGATLCEQTTEDTTLTWDYSGLRPLTQTERRRDSTDDRFFAIVTDLIGTPTELVDESGALAWRTRTTLWGTTIWTRDATAYTPLRFPGQYFDRESELHYNFFRYYDPELARYLAPDPLGLTPADNPVTYVHNPHTWSDPLGLGPCPPRIPGGGWDLSGDTNPLSIIPKDAVQEPWKPIPGGVEHGIKWKWTDDVTGKTVRMRVHGPDLGPHAGPNASSGPIYRIQIGHQFQDEAGKLYHAKIGNQNSPNYNETAINDTHIPWPSHLPVPYPH
ncbi:polymorphic toxin type 30 domain-containing protein [Streptomyces atratus]|uniref:putative T7SS-secreted protein n=1 Tax=Streptomyces atratus TaxID=1893 RepID=UPI002AC31849|nr:polymorphic toxin type 30 domain-containing protein [Streptomyces atratus]WPW29425.1 polymorphic toxin type 30 domain-containing protein [Streptomyces atratus]